MRLPLLLSILVAFVLSGCATLPEADRAVLLRYRVSPELYSRMLHRDVLTLTEIIELAEKKVPVPFVLRYLRNTIAVYHLRSDDVVVLRKAGVSSQIIDYLMATPTLYPRQFGDPFYYYDDDYWWGLPPLPLHDRHHHHHHGHHRH